MTDYTWAFDKSFLVFLLIAFAATALAERLRSLIPMPLIYGVIFLLGFRTGVLPADMLLYANMIAVGTIAYNVLVVHSGTMISLPLLRARWKEALLCAAGLVLMTVLKLLILTPVLGKGLAFLAPGSVLGGGDSCAIASRWVSESHLGHEKRKPAAAGGVPGRPGRRNGTETGRRDAKVPSPLRPDSGQI